MNEKFDYSKKTYLSGSLNQLGLVTESVSSLHSQSNYFLKTEVKAKVSAWKKKTSDRIDDCRYKIKKQLRPFMGEISLFAFAICNL